MIRVERTDLPVMALTHPGMKGKNNEDSFGVSAFTMPETPGETVLLAVLCDGIGGHRAGEVASHLAVETISNYVAESDGRNPVGILQEAIYQASEVIQGQAQQSSERQGMGTTCACVWLAGNRLFTATVGDSRIYLMRGNRIIQLSTDHTWIQEALERGMLQPSQVINHPNAHVIRRYLGSPSLPDVDFRVRLSEMESDAQSVANQGLSLRRGDQVLLCSDGLTDLVQDEEILQAFTRMSQKEAGEYLINLANERGGHDNITLVHIHILPQVEARAAAKPATQSMARVFALGCLGVIIFGALVGGVWGSYILYFRSATATPHLTQTITIPARATFSEQTTGPVLEVTQSLTPGNFSTITMTSTPEPGNPAIIQEQPLQVSSVTPWSVLTATSPLPVVTVINSP